MTRLVLLLSLILLPGCGEWVGACCGALGLLVVIPLLIRIERRRPGWVLLLLGLGVLASPLWLWDAVDNTWMEQLGIRMLLETDRLSHDLIAALFPRQPLAVRAALGALWTGGMLGSAAGFALGVHRSGRPKLALVGGSLLAVVAVALLQLGPDMDRFSPRAGDWPALEIGPRPQPLPLAHRQISATAGRVSLRKLPAYETRAWGPASWARPSPVQGVDCEVALTRAVWLGTDTVSEALWEAVMGAAPPSCGEACAPDAPAAGVSWRDAVDFANRFSELRGLTPAYTVEGRAVRWRTGADGYRLPTEAEWTLATRSRSLPKSLAPRGMDDDVPEWVWDVYTDAAACGRNPGVAVEASGVAVAGDLRAPRVVRVGPDVRRSGAADEGGVGVRLARSVEGLPRAASATTAPP
ncbi:MAG: SUMF1/EgtB/PvdO family nonheme iron enzyme [Alphaproteobacteria bacterium]|nr:SUMF1/EgtB/PvdO family nonheme iron enzyme [Alphaproteobacteria bacterium]